MVGGSVANPDSPLLKYHPLAADEVEAAFSEYAMVGQEVADGFKAELDHAEKLVLRSPESWATYFHGTRGFRFRRYPFVMAYIIREDTPLVIAVAHTRRRLGYWAERIDDA
nr:type II toxin-antitoxin system RelE/ParE family toxin [Rhodopirellula sp. JC740]